MDDKANREQRLELKLGNLAQSKNCKESKALGRNGWRSTRISAKERKHSHIAAEKYGMTGSFHIEQRSKMEGTWVELPNTLVQSQLYFSTVDFCIFSYKLDFLSWPFQKRKLPLKYHEILQKLLQNNLIGFSIYYFKNSFFHEHTSVQDIKKTKKKQENVDVKIYKIVFELVGIKVRYIGNT